MTSKVSNDLCADMLAAAKAGLDGGFFYGFRGPLPADASDPLDMDNDHTQLFKLSAGGDGVTGLTFQAPTGPALVKTPAQAWSGLVAFDGVEDGETELAPTFYRYCPAGDDGRDAGGGRLQGTLGGPSSGADVELGTDTVVRNGVNTQALNSFAFNLSTLG